MRTTKITPFQLYAMMTLYCLGTSSVLYFGREAKQDSWLSILFGGSVSIIIFITIYGQIFKLNRDSTTYPQALLKLFGKRLGKLIILLYGLYFIFICFFVVRDIIEVIYMYVLYGTPRAVIAIMLLFVGAYATKQGVETMFRVGEIYLFATILLYPFIFITLLFSNVVKLDNLFPLLENGIKPVIMESPPLFLAIPFGELSIFIVFLFHTNNYKKATRSGVMGLFTGVLIMMILNVFLVITLGPYMAGNAPFPVVDMVRLINVGDIIQRFDAITILIFLMGSVFQLFLMLYSASASLQIATGTRSYNIFILPVLIMIYFGSKYIGESKVEYLHFGQHVVPYWVNFPMEIILPGIILIASLVRYFIKGKGKNDSTTVESNEKTVTPK